MSFVQDKDSLQLLQEAGQIEKLILDDKAWLPEPLGNIDTAAAPTMLWY